MGVVLWVVVINDGLIMLGSAGNGDVVFSNYNDPYTMLENLAYGNEYP